MSCHRIGLAQNGNMYIAELQFANLHVYVLVWKIVNRTHVHRGANAKAAKRQKLDNMQAICRWDIQR
jgi:hypothetical protein